VRLSFRFLVPLVLAFVAIAYAVTPVVEGLMRQWHTRDLDIRATLVASSLQDSLREPLDSDDSGKLAARATSSFLMLPGRFWEHPVHVGDELQQPANTSPS